MRYQLGDPPFVGWDETPFFADSLDDLETAVTKGVHTVAVNSNHAATRTKYTVLLGMSTRKDIAPPPAVVVFTATGKQQPLGSIIRKNLEKDGAPRGVPFLFTTTGNTQAEMMDNYHLYVDRTLPGVLRNTTLPQSKGWRVTTFDSAESHKKWMAQNVDALLAKKEFPLRIGGGITPDVQTCDRGKNKPFKSAAREDQEEHDLQQACRGVSVPTSTRLDILRRVEKANRAADDEIDAELIFKQAGATLKLDGTEELISLISQGGMGRVADCGV